MKKLIFIFILALTLSACGSSQSNPVACTEEAKICPDGSAVGRTGPNCEFAPCPPAQAVPEDWMTFTDQNQSVSFQYPKDFGTVYEHPVDWPPIVAVSDGAWSCAPTPAENSFSERISEKIINNRVYCIEAKSEGAAGSIYTEYKYAGEISGKLIVTSFMVRAVQCTNYDEPKQSECVRERETFDLDAAIGRIMDTVKLK
jgi:hypothetical protein